MSFRTGSAKCNEKRGALWSSKNQILRVLSRIFINSHCRVRSHNPKRGCACREKKKNPWFRYKPRLTLAVAYIRGERNHLYECGLHKTQTAGINGSRLSPRPDQSNDDVVCFGATEQKSETTGFGQENRHILHCRFLFKLTFRSSLQLGCWETCAETSSKGSSAISRSGELKEMFRGWMRWRKWMKFPAPSWSRSFSRQCSARLSAMKVWYIIENRACASMCSNRLQFQQAAENVWVHLYEHFHV